MRAGLHPGNPAVRLIMSVIDHKYLSLFHRYKVKWACSHMYIQILKLGKGSQASELLFKAGISVASEEMQVTSLFSASAAL